MNRLLNYRGCLALLACVLLAAGAAGRLWAQAAPASATAPDQALTLTLDEAIQVALVSSYAVRGTRLDVENARAQVREAWGSVLPQVDANANYTRSIESANPFAGSDANDLFSTLGLIEWLRSNEEARLDNRPGDVLTFDEFVAQQPAVETGGDNPFDVPNQFQTGVTITQTLFNGSAFAAISGAQQLKEINQRGLDRQEQVVIDQVRQTFYQALLAQEQAEIQRLSVERTAETFDEVARRVQQGVAPKFQRLSTEVELANLETQLVQAQNQAAAALDNLKLTLGLPMTQPVRLRGELDAEDRGLYVNIAQENAVILALEQRPDLDQTRLAIELREINRNIARSEYLPRLEAFANFNYVGNVPGDRSTGFFSSQYWDPTINAGLRLTWNLFNGFQTSARVQQRQVELDRAALEREQLVEQVRLEVQQALRNLEAAQQRINSQERNVERAELNYQFASTRLREGVASPLEEREASEQLDLSRLNYLQAVSDYLQARSAFETAVGLPLASPRDVNLMLTNLSTTAAPQVRR